MQPIHDVQNSRFVLPLDDGGEGGYLAYEIQADGNLAAVSTVVSPALRGQGAAGKLLDALVEYAQANGLTITPVCSYVAKRFAQEPGRYAAVLAEGGEK